MDPYSFELRKRIRVPVQKIFPEINKINERERRMTCLKVLSSEMDQAESRLIR
jgi:hypothetical protein